MKRVILAINANQKKQSVVLIDSNPDLKMMAKNKLSFSKAKRIFVQRDGQVLETADYSIIEQDDLVLVSGGEDYIGKATLISQFEKQGSKVRVICDRAGVEDLALKQLEAVSKLPGLNYAVGMPDLHAGNQYPIGAVFSFNEYIYPELIGGDIGCGMALHRFRASKNIIARPQKVADSIVTMEGDWKGNLKPWMDQHQLTNTSFDKSLGTIGRGNHFAEIQLIHEIYDPELCDLHRIDKESAYLLVHSGSRGLGKEILEKHIETNGRGVGLKVDSMAAQEYLKQHNEALRWAKCNRDIISQRIFESLNVTESDKILDIWHNNISEIKNEGHEYLHRKGAAPSNVPAIVIPGSRGTLSYVVVPIGDQKLNGYSVAHGAGREISRQKALALNQSFKKSVVNEYGGVVICEDKDLFYEEAPNAYKNIDNVVRDLQEQGIQEGRGFPKFIKLDQLKEALDDNGQLAIRVEMCELTIGESLPIGIALQEVTSCGDVDILTKENSKDSNYSLKAHRNILCTVPYFDRKLNGSFRRKRNTSSTASLATLVDSKRPTIDLQKFSRDAVCAMLDFIYTDEIKKSMPASINTRCEIYALAHYTENKNLLLYMTNKITRDNLKFTTLLDLLTIPNVDPTDGLYPRCLEFFNERVRETDKIPDFQSKLYDMDKQTLIDLLSISLGNLHSK
ncbi:hypothetical protein HDV01_007041 [Terramyces sp. JEL0728]|nr:hypothetical protein HDV01_007041 [Terramyces sp. JEL0728]